MKIEIKNVNIKKQKEIILENFSLNFRGEKLIIQGHNGVGKTTLIEYIIDNVLDFKNVFYVRQIPDFFQNFL